MSNDDDLIQREARPAQPVTDADIRARQRSRARAMALLLFGFVALIFAISIVKIAAGYG